MSPPTDAESQMLRKQKRAAKAQKESDIAAALVEIEEHLFDSLDKASSARQHAKVTMWNGFVNEKSKEWEHLKEDFPGTSFVSEVARRISLSSEYKNLTEEQKAHYKEVAQKVRDERLNVGTTRTGDRRLTQGSVRKELTNLATRLDYINSVTNVECVLIAVRGHASDGLKPVYYASEQARVFLESHLKLQMSTLLDYMERSVDGGAIGLIGAYKNETQCAKGALCVVMTESLRQAATSVADDGTPPSLDDPEKIAMVAWKNYRL
ncbi:hypothetical protein FS749_005627 [Ceratobasidium sp. UAMH 11750]|nr:hypothetical protein FS749_005627 [Ceratobasidium sp. UAMH 11750]